MIYLDNAATSYPKPDSVKKEVLNAFDNLGGNPGRSSHHPAIAASVKIFEARNKIAHIFNALPQNIVFTYNTTYALNIAIKSSYICGSHVLISDLEHNSVLRPVASVTGNSFAGYNMFDSYIEYGPDERRHKVITSIRTKLRPLTKTIVCTARSNITGTSMPIREIGHFCRENDILFIVDAAQSAGYDDIDIERDYIDALCVPGHKGLYGPAGTGFIAFSQHAVSSGRISTFIEGGSGVASLDIGMPIDLPEKLEAGTLNVAGIAGLVSGIDHITDIGIGKIKKHEQDLVRHAYMALSFNKKIKFYGYSPDSPILLFNVIGTEPEDTAALLSQNDICVRAGYHCAPIAHKRFSTPSGGAVRMSVGYTNTLNEIERFVECVNKI